MNTTRIWLSLVCLMALSAISPGHAAGKAGQFGLGFELGDPTGFNGKYWLTSKNALDFVVGWNSWGYGRSVYRNGNCYNGNFRANNPDLCYDSRVDGYGYGWDNFHFHMDYLVHRFDIIKASIPLPIYYGAGVQYEYRKYWEDISWLGARGDFGIAFMPTSIPFDFFFELAPVLFILPAPIFDLNGGIGARFWF